MAITDNFTGTAGQKITARSGWSMLGSGTTGDNPEISAAGNSMGSAASNSDAGMVGENLASADHYVQAKLYSAFAWSGTGNLPLLAVRTDSRNEAWGLIYRTPTSSWQLYKAGAGAGLRSSYAATFVDGDVCRLEAQGNEIRFYLNGTLRITESGITDGLTTPGVGILVRNVTASAVIADDWESGVLAGGDTTAPVLTTAVGTATGSTTATVGATTDEANGTMYVVVTTSATQPSIAQIKASQDHTGATAPYAGSQTITTTGAKTFSATGLTASTTYYAHLLHTDAAANDSNRITSSSFTTTTPDVTAPTLSSGVGTVKSNALIVVGATTNEGNGTMYVVVTTSATPPSAAQVKLGQNNGGTAAVFAANQAIGSTGAKTFNATGLTQLTGYYPYIVHTDASGNDSSVLSIGLRTTFRNGATGQSVVDDTAAIPGVQEQGFLYNDVTLPADADKWFSYTIATPAVDSASLTLYANGSFVWAGGSDSFTYQLEVDGANVGSPALVTLTATGADVTAPTLSSATGTKTGTTTATGTVTTNEANGTLYYLTNTSASALSAAVLAGSTQAVTTSGVQNISRSGLTAATTYYHHYLHKDAAGNDSAVLSSNSFTTDAAADVTPPNLTSPTGATLGPTGAVGSVSTNEANGTLYWLTNTSATATDAAIKAANSQPVTATGVQNVTSSGLTASTVYYNHFLHRDAAGNDSTRSTSASFTTAAPGGPVTGNDHGGEAMRSCMRFAMYPAMNQG
jgi:hypothetical protein